MTQLRDLVTDWKLGLEAFCARHPHPALLHCDTAERMEREFRTSVGSSAPSLSNMEDELSLAPDLFVWPLRQGAATVYSDKINVGRTRTADVALLYPRVSKFHAYFTWEGDPPTYFLTDVQVTGALAGRERGKLHCVRRAGASLVACGQRRTKWNGSSKPSSVICRSTSMRRSSASRGA